MDQCRPAPIPTPVSNSFLGQQQQDAGSQSTPADVSNSPVDGSSYNAALNFLLRDMMAPVTIPLESQTFGLAGSVSNLIPNNPRTPYSGLSTDNVRRYMRALEFASTQYFGTIVSAPQTLTEEQLRLLMHNLEAVVQIIRNYLQNFSQALANSTQHDVRSLHQPTPNRQINSLHAMPAPSQHSLSLSNEIGAAEMSTEPSSQDLDTASSQYQISTHTGPSSVTEQTLLSPLVPPHHHRRASGSTQVAHDTRYYHRPLDNDRMLPERCTHARIDVECTPQTIDPALLVSPSDDTEHDSLYFGL